MKHTFRRNFTAYIWAVLGTALLFSCGQESQKHGAKHVIVIGVDGMSPDGVQKASTPNMDEMMANGASSMIARGVLPTSSSPNWASMIMGASPAQHGITSNAWRADQHILPTQVNSTGAFFPTIFRIAKEQKPELKTSIIYDWGGFGNLFDHADPTYQKHVEGEVATAQHAVEYWKNDQPNFMFVHLDHVDGAGHGKGHGSPAYYQSVEKADSLIGLIKQAVEKSPMKDETVIIITSDHGGKGFGHGGESLEEIQIPWIAYGKGIKENYQIKGTINTFDTPATVAELFGLKMPQAWIGRPVLEIFQGEEIEPEYTAPTSMRKPEISPKADAWSPAGGLYVGEPAEVKIANPNTKGEVRYTTDGSTPTAQSQMFGVPFMLKENTVVSSAVFAEGTRKSEVERGFFRFIDAEVNHGMKYQVYEVDEMVKLPNFNAHKPVAEGVALEPSLSRTKQTREEHVAVVYQGFIAIEKAGDYTFTVASDDGSRLFINDQLVADNDGDHGVIEKFGTVNLQPGKHQIRIEWFNGGGGKWLGAYYEGPEIRKQLIPASVLYVSQ